MDTERDGHHGEWYEIKLDVHLDERWLDWFDGFSFLHSNDGTTSLTRKVVDQAALHGVLKKLRDLGIPITSFARAGSIRLMLPATLLIAALSLILSCMSQPVLRPASTGYARLLWVRYWDWDGRVFDMARLRFGIWFDQMT